MAPPKCFFKRPEEFYMNSGTIFKPPKFECYSMPSSPNIREQSSPNVEITEPNDYFKPSMLQEISPNECLESPLDLSCKFVDSNNNELIQRLGAYLLQHQAFLPNNYLNLERLFSQLPQQINSSFIQPYPKVYITPPFKSENSYDDNKSEPIDPSHLSSSRLSDQRYHLSPRSASESIRDNSSSETSSQYTCSQQKTKNNKRKNEGKILRPFKLYKNNQNSQDLMEALGINEEDEEWLKSIVEYKSVDDIFLFLTNCMNKTTKPLDLTDEVVEKIQLKFGHIFQNCNKSISNPRMIRHPDMTPKELKTEEYWDKRRKNNEAAKRSREARRHKENNLNQDCEKLQSENDCIRKEIERVKIRIEDIKRSIS